MVKVVIGGKPEEMVAEEDKADQAVANPLSITIPDSSWDDLFKDEPAVSVESFMDTSCGKGTSWLSPTDVPSFLEARTENANVVKNLRLTEQLCLVQVEPSVHLDSLKLHVPLRDALTQL